MHIAQCRWTHIDVYANFVRGRITVAVYCSRFYVEWPETICMRPMRAHQMAQHGNDACACSLCMRTFQYAFGAHTYEGNMRKDVRNKRTSYDASRRRFHRNASPMAVKKRKAHDIYEERGRSEKEEEATAKKENVSSAGKLKRCGYWNRQSTRAKTSRNTVSTNFTENIEARNDVVENFHMRCVCVCSVYMCSVGIMSRHKRARQRRLFGMLRKAFLPRIFYMKTRPSLRVLYSMSSAKMSCSASSAASASAAAVVTACVWSFERKNGRIFYGICMTTQFITMHSFRIYSPNFLLSA